VVVVVVLLLLLRCPDAGCGPSINALKSRRKKQKPPKLDNNKANRK
jgi:hypothetical protein